MEVQKNFGKYKIEHSDVDECPQLQQNLLGHLTEESREVVWKKIRFFKTIHQIREVYGKQCYVGFIGPQNAGKSTLLNTLWETKFKTKAETGCSIHTSKPTKYKIANEIFAVDFPGSNSLKKDVIAGFETFGQMNNMFVYVIEYNGDPTKTFVENVKSAYRILRVSGHASNILFCINKAHTKDPEKDFGDKFRAEYVEQIKDYIRNHPYDEKETTFLEKMKMELAIPEHIKNKLEKILEEHKAHVIETLDVEDFIFTDWEVTCESGINGVKGAEEVRKRIRSYLLDELKILGPDSVHEI